MTRRWAGILALLGAWVGLSAFVPVTCSPAPYGSVCQGGPSLAWQAQPDPNSPPGYNPGWSIERSVSSGAFVVVTTLSSERMTYVDTDPAIAGVTSGLCYRLKGYLVTRPVPTGPEVLYYTSYSPTACTEALPGVPDAPSATIALGVR